MSEREEGHQNDDSSVYQVRRTRFRKCFVLMVDALGVGSLSKSETREYYDRFRLALAKASSDIPDDIKLPERRRKVVSKSKKRDRGDPKDIFSFGDTVIFIWPYNKRSLSSLANELVHIAFSAFLIFVEFTALGIPIRGAISYGDCIVDGKRNIAIGPAITEAAAYYEAANWLGILVTPEAGKALFSFQAQGDFFFGQHYIPYDVPLSEGGTTRLWTLNWPFYYYVYLFSDMFKENKDYANLGSFGVFLQHISAMKWFGGNEKYWNAIKYYKHAVEYISKYGAVSDHVIEYLRRPFLGYKEHEELFGSEKFGQFANLDSESKND